MTLLLAVPDEKCVHSKAFKGRACVLLLEPQRMPGGRKTVREGFLEERTLGLSLKWRPDKEDAWPWTLHPHPHSHCPPSSVSPKAWPGPTDSLIYPLPAASLLAELSPQTSGLVPPPPGWGREWGEAWP